MYIPRKVAVLVCLVLILVLCVCGHDTKSKPGKVHESECNSQRTCAKCISTPYCKWCSEYRPQSVAKPSRCVDSRITNDETWCPSEKIMNPAADHTIEENDEFSSKLDNQVQLKPQRLKVFLRAGQKHTVKIQYKQAVDYPVDLYFLMDLSASMEPHRDKLSKLGKQLSDAMQALTKNFRLGFGSFVDKCILPMTSTQEDWLRNGCMLPLSRKKCDPPYDYKHQMNLTDDISAFERNVVAAPISGNIDIPEGGFDALMQAMVCGDRIGWRNKARHILVYSSDATYHIAGDGRLAGLVEPNDEMCHLNKDGFYDQAEILDYPSISQINRIAREYNKNIIFAVTDDVIEAYRELSSVVQGSTYGLLTTDSKEVVALVQSHSQKLTTSVRMIDNSDEEMFEVKYFSRCLDKRASIRERNECDGIRVKTPIEFEVSIKALKCPVRPEDRRHTIAIQPEGVDEKVIIDVEIICDCDCAKDYEPKSAKCSGHGNLVCGICDCDKGYQRDACECKVNRTGTTVNMTSCRGDNDEICSGNGECNSCGVCVCHERQNPEEKYSGDKCEYSNFLCARSRDNGMICGGPARGECIRDVCECKPGYTGTECGCSTRNDTCINPKGNGEECSGFGKCNCGKCDCKEDSRRSGQYCEECPTCANQFCDEYKDCVECLAYGTGPQVVEGTICPNCSNIDHELVDKIDENSTSTIICPTPDSTGCTFVFSYTEMKNRSDTAIVFVNAEKTKKCASKIAVSPWGVAASAIGLTLFLGLIGLIAWKLLTSYYDHREWVKFEKERVSANWERGENPLFKEPTTSFKNPTFDNQDTQ